MAKTWTDQYKVGDKVLYMLSETYVAQYRVMKVWPKSVGIVSERGWAMWMERDVDVAQMNVAIRVPSDGKRRLLPFSQETWEKLQEAVELASKARASIASAFR